MDISKLGGGGGGFWRPWNKEYGLLGFICGPLHMKPPILTGSLFSKVRLFEPCQM